MTKETDFEHPPRGHVALLYYDVANDRFQVVQGDDVDTAIPVTAKAMLTSSLVHGYDGSNWRKLPLLWGYTARYAERENLVVQQAGTKTLTFSSPEEGEIWRITGLSCLCNTANPSAVSFLATIVTYPVYVVNQVGIVANQVYSWVVDVVLGYQDTLVVYWGGCLVDDDLSAYAYGYKMKIAM